MVGELAVRLPVGGEEVEVQVAEDRADHVAGHPVAAVDDHAQPADRARVDHRQRALAEVRVDLDLLGRAASRGIRQAGLEQVADRGDPGFAGERQRALADELHAGVGLGVVRGGHHRSAVELARADEEIEHLGADHAGVEHVDALVDKAVAQAPCHLRGLQPHIAPKAHA